jgi:hypothetical protein
MKRILLATAILFTTFTGFSQKATWKEMTDFHGVMAKTFHPAEENNLQPVRDSASVLVSRAKSWKSSAVPQGFNGTVTKPILKKLVSQCEAINKAVKKNKPDADLKTMITKAHDIFHEIMEKCREGEHH